MLVSTSVSSKQLIVFYAWLGQKGNKNQQQKILLPFKTIPLYYTMYWVTMF